MTNKKGMFILMLRVQKYGWINFNMWRYCGYPKIYQLGSQEFINKKG